MGRSRTTISIRRQSVGILPAALGGADGEHERRGGGSPGTGRVGDDVDLTAEFRERNLAQFKVPIRWEVVAEMPRTLIGKIQKFLLAPFVSARTFGT